jgi:GTP-binding protein
MAKADALTVTAARFVAAATPGSTLPAAIVSEIAFAGRSNVGKSSLLNTLMQRKNLVRTSSTPGCTRGINIFEAICGDGLVTHLVDLPGYGFANRSKQERASWGPHLEAYLRERPTLRGVALLVDVRRGIEKEEDDLLEFLESVSHPSRPPLEVILVATKLDKVPRSRQKTALMQMPSRGLRAIGFSSETGEGRDELWRKLRRATGVGKSPEEVEALAAAEAAEQAVT